MKLEDLKQGVEELSPEEIKQFSAWFEARMADLWDEQIERDAQTGKLDNVLREARENYRTGNYTELRSTARIPGSGFTTANCRTKSRVWQIKTSNC